MASSSSSPPTAGRNPKRYMVAALMAIVAAAVVVTVFFVVLSPARVTFSVTKASSYLAEDGVGLNLTIAANNTSHRAAVKYQSMFVDVSNNTGPELVSWVRAKVTTDMSEWHPHGSGVATVDATVSLLGGPWTTAFFAGGGGGGGGDDDDGGAAASLVVQVTAGARFKVAGMRTRLYDISVRCGPVTFERQSRTASSSSARAVGCSPV